MSIEKALGKLRAAQMCHPNAVQALIDEAIAAIQQAEDQQPAAPEPVLTVEKEPDYWSGGHFHKGSKPHINPMKVWSLPIGTKLYTRPAPSVPDDVVRDAERFRRLNLTEEAIAVVDSMLARTERQP